jgi:solute carrier family 25 protein 38
MIRFKGCLSEVQLLHSEPTKNNGPAHRSKIIELNLEETTASSRPDGKPLWSGASDLTIYPGQTKVFAFTITFRDAGEVNALSSIAEIETDRFDLVCSSTMNETDILPDWWIKGLSGIRAKKLSRTSGIFAQIHPKPPKMEISLPNLLDHYYADEPVALDIEIINKEDETTEAVLEVRLLGLSTDTLEYSWMPHPDSTNKEPVKIPATDSDSHIELPGHVVGRLERNARRTETITFKAPSIPSGYALEIKVLYHLLSDEDIPISKTLTTDLVFDGPFEASYEFSPRVHPDPWPSMFEVHDGESGDAVSGVAGGIAQRWHLKAKVASFAEEILMIDDMGLNLREIHGGAVCDITKEFPSTPNDILPQEIQERSFCLDMRKIKFEERRSAALDMGLSITWRRKSDSRPHGHGITSILAMPRLHLPSSEPRVLASVALCTTIQSVTAMHLDYTLENPTTHFLTFEVSMEASEEFGFHGPKLQSLTMLPFSRQTVHYNLAPMVKGAWIMPQLRVVDRYFNKTLKIQATDGIKMDKKGIMIWVDEEK